MGGDGLAAVRGGLGALAASLFPEGGTWGSPYARREVLYRLTFDDSDGPNSNPFHLISPSADLNRDARRFSPDSEPYTLKLASVTPASMRYQDPLRTPPITDVKPERRVEREDPAERIRLRVVTINAYSFREGGVAGLFYDTPRPKRRISQLARWLRQTGPDVVLLQEVWQRKQFRQLMRQSGYEYGVYFTDLGNGVSDLAILSRYPLSDPQFQPSLWQGSSAIECGRDIGISHRIGLGTAVMRVGDEEILLANVHPIHRRYQEEGFESDHAELTPERVFQQLEIAMRLNERIRHRPTIIGGDFNFDHHQEEAWVMDRLFGLQDSCNEFEENPLEPERECTYCEDNPLNHGEFPGEGIIDHIYASPDFKITHSRIAFPHPVFSDHQPVVMDVVTRTPAEMEALREVWRGDAENDLGVLFEEKLATLLTEDKLKGLEAYFQDVSFHFYCLFSDQGSDQAESALVFIDALRREVNRTRLSSRARTILSVTPDHGQNPIASRNSSGVALSSAVPSHAFNADPLPDGEPPSKNTATNDRPHNGASGMIQGAALLPEPVPF